MMAGLAERFRVALRQRRPVRPRLLALPDPPRPLLALPAPPGAEAGPVCQACGYRHPPLRGLAPTYATPIDSTLNGRPRPLRDDAPAPIVPINPWRTHA